MAWEIAMTTWTVLSKLGHSIVDPVTHKYKLLQDTRDSRKQMYNEEVKTFVVNMRLILHFSLLLKSWCAIPYSEGGESHYVAIANSICISPATGSLIVIGVGGSQRGLIMHFGQSVFRALSSDQ